MPRLTRRPRPLVRPSRLGIFARRRRRLVKPALLGVLLLCAAGYGLHVADLMRSESRFAPMRSKIARLAALRVTEIRITGRNMTQEGQVLAALGVAKGDLLLGFSVEAARLRIDQLAFVEHSTVERRLPGTVVVALTERRPYAVWQFHDRFMLIDHDGAVVVAQGPGLSAKDAEAFTELPLVVGAGAAKAASSLIETLNAEPVVQRQVVAATRIGLRRWNLDLRSGAELLLPEGAEAQALHRASQLDDEMHLLERPVLAIDMRLPDRLIVRTRPDPAPPASSLPDGDPAGVQTPARRPA